MKTEQQIRDRLAAIEDERMRGGAGDPSLEAEKRALLWVLDEAEPTEGAHVG